MPCKLLNGCSLFIDIGSLDWVGEPNRVITGVLSSGVNFDPGALCDFIASQAASFMVPMYVAVIDEMPFTPTQKVAKTQLPRRTGPELWTNPQARR